jgi:hypothetical protein
LAVADFGVVKAEALEDPAQHSLPVALRISEHVDAGEASAEVLADDALIGTRFAGQPLVHLLQRAVPGTRHALPNHTSQRRGDTLPHLVGQQSWQASGRLLGVFDERPVEVELGHRRWRERRVSECGGNRTADHFA